MAGPQFLGEAADFIYRCLGTEEKSTPSSAAGAELKPCVAFCVASTVPGTRTPTEQGAPIPPNTAKSGHHSMQEGGRLSLRPLSTTHSCHHASSLPGVDAACSPHPCATHQRCPRVPSVRAHLKAALLVGLKPSPAQPWVLGEGAGQDSSMPGRSLSKRRGPRQAWPPASTEEARGRPQIRSRIFPFNDLLYGFVFFECFFPCFLRRGGQASVLFLAGLWSSWCPSDASWDEGCARAREGGTWPQP